MEIIVYAIAKTKRQKQIPSVYAGDQTELTATVSN
jgi:hypothetical protein